MGGAQLPIKFITPSPGAYFASGQPFELRWTTQQAGDTENEKVFRVCMKAPGHVQMKGEARSGSKEKRRKAGGNEEGDAYGGGGDSGWGDESSEQEYDGSSSGSSKYDDGSWDPTGGAYDSGQQDASQGDVDQSSWDDQSEADSPPSRGRKSSTYS